MHAYICICNKAVRGNYSTVFKLGFCNQECKFRDTQQHNYDVSTFIRTRGCLSDNNFSIM